MNSLLDLCRGRLSPEELPDVGPKSIYFFICSAYVDFTLERQIFADNVYPQLRQYTREKYGLELQIIDPRPQNTALPLELVNYRESFIEQCRKFCKSNSDCCPVILLGQKFGLPLLPTRIPVSTFNMLMTRACQKRANPYHALLEQIDFSRWYTLDENNLQEAERVLKSLDQIYPELKSEDYLKRSAACQRWNEDRDNLVRILYHYAHLCVQEDLMHSHILNEMFIFELSTAVQSAFNKNSEILGDTRESYSPIVLQRTIVDVEQFGDKSQNSNYLDILPSIFQRTPERAGRVDSLLLDHLQILYQNIATHLRDGVANAPELSMKVLWRNPSGIDRKFHKDYLCELTDKFKQMAYAAIDSRAKAKLAILNWASEIPREPVRSSDHKSLRLPVSESAVVKKARGLQQSVRAWDDAWNNIRHIGRLSSLAINRGNEVRTLVNYLLDDTVSVPLFVYSVSTADRNPNERNIAADDVASAVASAAFLEAQNIHSKSSNTVLIGRIVTRQIEIPQFLQSLADQLSVALCTDRDKFDPTTLTSLISSIGIQEAVHSENRILLILGGVQQIVDSDELDQTIPSIPLVEATHLPNKICPGIRLILSGVVNTFTTNSDPLPVVLVPKTCLTLEISPTSVAGAIEVCVGTLAKNNRMLTGDQITTVHQSLSRLEGRSDLLNCSFLLAQCLFTQLRSDESIDSDVIIKWVNDAGFSALISRYCPYFSLDLIFQMINCLRLASLTVGNESQSGLTRDELHDLLLFDRQVQKDRKNMDSLHPGREINSTTLLDPAERVLLLQALSQSSMLLCANASPVEQYLDGYLRCVLDSNLIVFESTHPIQGDGAMTDEVLDSWFVTLTTPCFHGNNNLSPDDRKSTALLKLGNQVDKEMYFSTSSSLGLEYNTRYLRQIGCCLLQKGDLLEWASHTWFSYSWLYCTLFSIGSYGLLDMFPQKDCPLLQNNMSGSSASIHFQSVLVCEALMNSAHLLQNHPNLLAAEMIGQLLPFESSTKTRQFPRLGVDALLEQCRAVGAWYNAIQPVHTYSDIPGNPMIGRFPCPSSVLDMCIQGHSKLNELLLRLDDDPVIYRFACSSLKRLPDCEAGYGRMFPCPNGKYAVISDSAQSGTIKVYQLDTNTQGRVPLIGQINTGLWISASCGLLLTDLKVEILALDLTDEHVGLIVHTKRLLYPEDPVDNRTDSAGKPVTSLTEHLSAGTSNHVVIFELTTGKPVQILNPFPRSTFIALSQIGRKEIYETDKESSAVFFTNSDRVLLGFRTNTGEQFFALTMESSPKKLLPSWIAGGQNLFVQCEHSAKIVQLKLNCNFEVSKSITISFENSLSGNEIVDFRLASSNSYLLIHSYKQILVYDFHTDLLVARIFPPVGMPQTIRLPNEAPRPLSFTDAQFALHDRIVVTCIFRTVLLWDIQLDRLLVNLYAPIGSLTRLLTDATQRLLIGYSASSKELYLWDLTMALTNITQPHNEALIYPIDRLSRPVVEIVPIRSSNGVTHMLARCVKSDELGVFDCSTGRMTDLFTHDGRVISITLSKCGCYVLVGLELPEGYQSHPVNMVWSLKSRQLVYEYGHSVGIHLSGGSSAAAFLQLETTNTESSTLFEIHVTESENHVGQPHFRVTSKLTLAPLVKHVLPFWTANEQCLISLVSDTYDNHRNVYLHPRLVMMIEQQSEWKVQYPDLTIQWKNSEIVPFILSVRATEFESYILILFATTNPDVCHDESADWTSGVGLPKSLLLVLAQTTPPRLSIQKMIVGLCDTSPHKSIYYTPTRNTVYDEHCGRFYTVPDCQAQIDLRQLETVELFDCSYIWGRSASSSGHILCHGCIQTEHVWVFSLVQCIYLVSPILGDLCGLIDVHHPISFVSVNGDKLYVGCADGYVLTYHVNLTAGGMKPDENERPSAILSCTLVKSNSDSKFSNLGLQGTGEMRRTRTWDHDLEVTPNTEGSVHNALDLTNLETVSASLRTFRHQFTISKAKTCLLM